MVGEIPYNVYSQLFDVGTDCIQKAYELGKAELEKENAELNSKLEKTREILEEVFNLIPASVAEGMFKPLSKAREFLMKVEK